MMDAINDPQELFDVASSARKIDQYELMRIGDSAQIDLAGVVYTIVMTGSLASKVSPALDWEGVNIFLRKYYLRCVLLDPTSDWADSRYSACWDAANWVASLSSNDKDVENEIQNWISWLKTSYEHGDTGIKEALQTAFFDRICANGAVARGLELWRRDPLICGLLGAEK